MDRQNIKTLRPDIVSINDQTQSREIEKFQSEVLRPIAKYQNQLILKTYQAYLEKYKLTLEGKSVQDQEAIITKAMKTNKELKSFYQGLIAALMTFEEFVFYKSRRSEINKRITSLLIQRIASQMIG